MPNAIELWEEDTQSDERPPTSFLEESYPTLLDLRIERVLALFERAPRAKRERLIHAPLSAGRVRLLLRYVDRMAALALVEGDERHLTRGRLALMLIGQRAASDRLMALHLLLGRTARLLDESLAA